MVALSLPADGELNWGPKTRAAFTALNNGKIEGTVDDGVSANSIVQRTANSNVQTGSPIADEDAVSLDFLRNELATRDSTIETLRQEIQDLNARVANLEDGP